MSNDHPINPRRRFARLAASLAGALLGLALASPTPAQQQQVLNLYSARHYSTDEALYDNFTKATGIRINRVDADDAGILNRLKAEGAASPADVILLVDAARLYRGEQDGLFLPIKSKLLDEAIPAQLRARPNADGASAWFGFSTRARIIAYDKTKLKREDVDSYEKLADPRFKGQVCIRSGAHPYNLSLIGALLEHLGEARTEAWIQGLKANLARPPKGGDTDQLRAVASGECALAVSNSYYMARILKSTRPEDQAVAERVGIVFPNQGSWGTHVNISGGGVARHAKNRDAAQRFLEYLASPEAQAYFANGNNEWPTVKGAPVDNPALRAMGGANFKSETIPVAAVGANVARVQALLDRAGFP